MTKKQKFHPSRPIKKIMFLAFFSRHFSPKVCQVHFTEALFASSVIRTQSQNHLIKRMIIDNHFNLETIKTTTYFLRYDDLSENLVPEADVWESLEKVPDSLKIPAKPVSTKKRGPPIGTVRKSKGGKKTTVEKS
jgi:hypothetical protein